MTTQWLSAKTKGRPIGVDRENKILRGYVVVQEGPIKDRPGEFTQDGLSDVVRLINTAPRGIKSRFTHPGLSSDGLGKFLGRAKNAVLDGDRVRADLHFSETAFNTPNGDLAGYVMDLAEEDSDALSSSMVGEFDQKYRTNDKGERLQDDDGEDLPPVWYPKKLHASDIVDEGAAVDGLLSAGIDPDGLPDATVYFAYELLNRQFPKLTREELTAKVNAFLARYCEHRYGSEAPADNRGVDFFQRRLEHRLRKINATGLDTPLHSQ